MGREGLEEFSEFVWRQARIFGDIPHGDKGMSDGNHGGFHTGQARFFGLDFQPKPDGFFDLFHRVIPGMAL